MRAGVLLLSIRAPPKSLRQSVPMKTPLRPFRSCSALSLFVLMVSAVGLRAAPPAITLQPAVVTAPQGAAATFTVAASATAPLSYQWRHLGVPLAGADAPTLDLAAVSLPDAGFYDVVVTADGESTVSLPGRLLVEPTTLADTFRADPTFALAAEAPGGRVAALCVTATSNQLLVGGSFTTIGEKRRDGLARLDSSFVYDPEFKPVVVGSVFAIVEQADGRILIGGGFTQVNGVPRSCIARLNADGTLDSTFFPGAGCNGNVNAVVVQSDGGVVIGGNFTRVDGVACGRIARLHPDGSLDQRFNAAVGAGFNSAVAALARQSDDRLVVGGYFTQLGGRLASRLARLQRGGEFDPDFVLPTTPGGPSGCDNDVLALAVASPSDDRVYVGGRFSDYSGQSVARVMRLEANGIRDSEFNAPIDTTEVEGINGAVRALSPASEGRLVIGGDFTRPAQRCVARLASNGSIDSTWLPPEDARPATFVFSVASYNGFDGRVAAGGEFTQIGSTAGNASGVVRYFDNGALDAAPGGALRRPATINAAVPAAGGGWFVGGTFTHLNNVECNRIARISETGVVDGLFSVGAEGKVGFNGPVETIVADGAGRLLVGGSFSTYKDISAPWLVRLETTGERDTGFALAPGIIGTISAVSIQPDGLIVVGGGFARNLGSARNNLARLLPGGALDPSFDTGSGQSGVVWTVAIEREGHIVAGGNFTRFNGASRGYAARFDASGLLDPNFNAGLGLDWYVNAAVIRADDSLVIGGAFQHFDGVARGAAVGFAAGGSLLTGYNSGTGFTGGAVAGLHALPDGRLYASGSFTGLAGQPVQGLARLNADGTAAMAFAAFDRSVGENRGVIAAGDGRLLVLAAAASTAPTESAPRGGRQIGLVVLRPEASPLPVIGSAPAMQEVAEGAEVALNVGASGAALLRYQWSRDGVVLPGATAAALDLADVLPSDSATYSVVVRNDYGTAGAGALVTVVPALSYANWAAAHFSAEELGDPAFAGVLADPYGVGVANLSRYAFGLRPRGVVAPPTRVLTRDEAGALYLAVGFNRRPAADDLVYTVQSSEDLVEWSPVAVLAADLPLEQIVRDTVPIGAALRRFLRVSVDLAP